MKEKFIKGFNKLYSIDTDGNVYSWFRGSFPRKEKKKLCWTWDTRGFAMVALHKNGDGGKISVHRLVYETFVGKVEDGMEVYHVNGDKKDNRLENLKKVKKRGVKSQSRPIYLMEEDYPYREFVFADGTEAARFFKYKEKTVVNTYIYTANMRNRDTVVIRKTRYYYARG